MSSGSDEYSSETGVESPERQLPDFEFEEYTRNFQSPGLYYKRPVLEKWDREQVEKFWIPVETVILDRLEEQNKVEIEKIFSNLE